MSIKQIKIKNKKRILKDQCIITLFTKTILYLQNNITQNLKSGEATALKMQTNLLLFSFTLSVHNYITSNKLNKLN